MQAIKAAPPGCPGLRCLLWLCVAPAFSEAQQVKRQPCKRRAVPFPESGHRLELITVPNTQRGARLRPLEEGDQRTAKRCAEVSGARPTPPYQVCSLIQSSAAPCAHDPPPTCHPFDFQSIMRAACRTPKGPQDEQQEHQRRGQGARSSSSGGERRRRRLAGQGAEGAGRGGAGRGGRSLRGRR